MMGDQTLNTTMMFQDLDLTINAHEKMTPFTRNLTQQVDVLKKQVFQIEFVRNNLKSELDYLRNEKNQEIEKLITELEELNYQLVD